MTIVVFNAINIAHGRNIKAMLDQVRTESMVLGSDRVLVDLREKEVGQECTEDAQCARHKERILTSTNRIGGIAREDRENIGADESSNLANRCGV